MGTYTVLWGVATIAIAAHRFELPPLVQPATNEHHSGKVIWADLVTPDVAGAKRDREPLSRRLPMAGLILAFALVAVTRGAPPAMAQTEINHLLGFAGSSDCEIYRNGSWYNSKRAQAHLRSKYQWLAALNQINTAEDFIEKAATKNSLSGRPYEVRCDGGETVTSNRWLRFELARYG